MGQKSTTRSSMISPVYQQLPLRRIIIGSALHIPDESTRKSLIENQCLHAIPTTVIIMRRSGPRYFSGLMNSIIIIITRFNESMSRGESMLLPDCF